MNAMQNSDGITSAIQKAIKAEVESIVEQEAKAAAVRVEKRVGEQVGSIAATCLEHFSFERMGNHLQIVVDFEGTRFDKKQ